MSCRLEHFDGRASNGLLKPSRGADGQKWIVRTMNDDSRRWYRSQSGADLNRVRAVQRLEMRHKEVAADGRSEPSDVPLNGASTKILIDESAREFCFEDAE